MKMLLGGGPRQGIGSFVDGCRALERTPLPQAEAEATLAAYRDAYRRPAITNYQQLKRHVIDLQEGLILWALEQTNGNKDQAARLIGMHRRQFQRLYKRWQEAQPSDSTVVIDEASDLTPEDWERMSKGIGG